MFTGERVERRMQWKSRPSFPSQIATLCSGCVALSGWDPISPEMERHRRSWIGTMTRQGVRCIRTDTLAGFDTGRDEICNIVIAGLSRTEVDAVGSYIMGQNPNELPYTRIAKERGIGECDPQKIDIYWIRDNGDIVPVKNIAEIKRHPIGLNWARKEDPSQRLFW